MNTKNSVSKVAWLLVIIGALNWGLVGLGTITLGWGTIALSIQRELNIIYITLGRWPMLEHLVYILVGLSALYIIIKGKKGCTCGSCM